MVSLSLTILPLLIAPIAPAAAAALLLAGLVTLL